MHPKPYDFVTFDCYGTLIDWENGIRDAFLANGVPIDRNSIIPMYSAIEPEVQREGYRRYADVLTEATARAAQLIGWSIPAGSERFLADSLPSWKPFADTNAALESLKRAGYKLGILSNIDDDLLRATRRHFTVDFDLIVTAEQVQSYKPARNHFLRAKETIGDMRWLHAAESNFHDIVPANAMGIANAWINRGGAPMLAGGEPKYQFRTLKELAAAIV